MDKFKKGETVVIKRRGYHSPPLRVLKSFDWREVTAYFAVANRLTHGPEPGQGWNITKTFVGWLIVANYVAVNTKVRVVDIKSRRLG